MRYLVSITLDQTKDKHGKRLLLSYFQACLKSPESMSSIDHKVVPLPWNERLFSPAKKRLKIGYYTDDGYFPLTPACKRAVEVKYI